MGKDSVSFLSKHFNDIPKELRLEALEGFEAYGNYMKTIVKAIQEEIDLGIKTLLEIADINPDVPETIKQKLEAKEMALKTLMFDHPNTGGLTYLTFKGHFVAGSIVTFMHELNVVKRRLLTPGETKRVVDQIKKGDVVSV